MNDGRELPEERTSLVAFCIIGTFTAEGSNVFFCSCVNVNINTTAEKMHVNTLSLYSDAFSIALEKVEKGYCSQPILPPAAVVQYNTLQ